MTDWIERATSHAVHKTLRDLGDALTVAETKSDDTEQVPAALARLQHVVHFSSRVLDGFDPLLLGTGTLDSLNNQLGHVLEQVSQFASNANIDHLNNANNEADKLLPTLSTVIAPVSPQDIEAVRSTMEMFDRATRERVQELQEQTNEGKSAVEALQANVGLLQETIKSEKARIDQVVAQYQQQFSETQDSRQQNFNSAENQRTERFDADVKTWREKFLAFEADQEETFRTLATSIESNSKELIEANENSISKLLKDIEARRDKARDLVGIIAGTGMAGGYQRDADEQRKAYAWWNGATIVGFIGMIGFAVWLFIASTGEGEFSWSKTVARFVAITVFGLFAAYASRMAMKHRESERQHRHKQLALESVNSFLEDLEPEVQKQVKQKMADVFFTQPQSLSGMEQDVAPTTIEGLMKLISRFIDKLG